MAEGLKNGEAEREYPNLDEFLAAEFNIEENSITLSEGASVEGESKEDFQRRVAVNILKALQEKGALATPEESREYWEQSFKLTPYVPPEQWAAFPGGVVDSVNGSRERKVFLNYFLSESKSDYIMQTVLEEAIHWSQWKQNKWEKPPYDTEVDAKSRILKMAEFLRFDEARIERIKYLIEHGWSPKEIKT